MSSYEVTLKFECPECEHDLHDGATTCPTCTASDYLEDR